MREVRSIVIAIVLALGILASGVGLRHVAASEGCDALNALEPSIRPGFALRSNSFDTGDEVFLTADGLTLGDPTEVQIAVGDPGVNVATTPFPGTVSYLIPATGVIDALWFRVDSGMAELTTSCTATQVTATPTETPTETPTVTETPTQTATATPSPTPTNPSAGEEPTETPIVTVIVPTETATPIEVASAEPPTSTPASEAEEGVSELPNTGGGPSSGRGMNALWLLVALFAVTVVGVGGLRARRQR